MWPGRCLRVCGLLLGVTVAIAEARFAPVVTVDDIRLEKVAEAGYRLLWKRITDVALYVDARQRGHDNNDILSPRYAKYLTIEYHMAVSAERFRSMTRKLLEDNWPPEALRQVETDIDRFCQWLQAVERGDRYAVYWLPDGGLTLALNGTPRGTLHDPRAAEIILSIWLGRAAVSEGQRDALLAVWRQRL